MVTIRDSCRGGVAVLLLVQGCGGRPADARVTNPLLDTATVARVSHHLTRGVELIMRDSAAVAAAELERARALNPGADVITYWLAIARAVQGDTLGLIGAFDTLAARHSCLAPPEGGFPRWQGASAVTHAMQVARDSAPALRASEVAFSLPDRTLFPEGITYDPDDGSVYLSSLRRRLIVRVTRAPGGEAAAAPFTSPGRDTLYSVLGMKIDPVRRRLWVVTTAEGFAEGETPDELGRSAVLVYDLKSGRTLRRIDLSPPPRRLTNDLALDTTGAAWITDTSVGALYRVAPDADSVETVLAPGSMTGPNGIVVTPDGRGVLVADGANGLLYVDIARRTLRRVPQPEGIMPLFLDGLTIHGQSLLAVANPVNLGWVLRFDMSATFDTIRASTVLACNDSRLRQPTTGVVAGDTLFYVGTSQYGRIPPPGVPVDSSGLVDIAVMRLILAAGGHSTP